LTPHRADEQSAGKSIPRVPRLTEFPSAGNTGCPAGAGSAGLSAKLPLLRPVGTGLCYRKNQVIRAVTPPGKYTALVTWFF